MQYKVSENLDHVMQPNEQDFNRYMDFFRKHSIEEFRIKDWKIEAGERFHPLLKDSPLLVTDMWREKFMELDSEIQDIFNGSYEKEFFDEDGITAAYKSYHVSESLRQKMMAILAKDLDVDEEYLMFSVIENQTGFIAKPQGEEQVDAAQNWHTDVQLKQTVKLIMYLSDVEDELDGPFEYIDKPEERHFNIDTLHDLNIKPDVGFNTLEYILSLPEEKKKKMYGPRYTAVVFDVSCNHKGNYPTRRPRKILMADVRRKNNISALRNKGE
jgi:hypothetical protein